MNVELLLRVKAKILEEPRQFDMANYFITNDNIPNCHTAACIGGWAVSLNRNVTPNQAEFSSRKEWVRELAREVLELTNIEADRLFYATHESWGDFAIRYNAVYGKDPTLAAQVAAERIDHFIATKGLE